MKIELWKLSDVKPYPGNPRINDGAVEVVAKSLQEFGFRQPIVVDSEGVIVCGHTRFKAAQKLGLEKVPVHVATDLTPEQIKAYRIADNQTATLADWDYDLLPIELADLQAANYDLGLLGFDQDELAKILGGDLNDGLCDPDDVPAPPDEAITQSCRRQGNDGHCKSYLAEPLHDCLLLCRRRTTRLTGPRQTDADFRNRAARGSG